MGQTFKADRQKPTPIMFNPKRGGVGISGLTVVANVVNGQNVSQILDQADLQFRDAPASPNFAMVQASAPLLPGLYAKEGGLDLSTVTIPPGTKTLFVVYKTTINGLDVTDVDTIQLLPELGDLILHYDGDSALNPEGGQYTDPIGGGQAGFNDLITAMNGGIPGGVKSAYLRYLGDFIRPTGATGNLTNKRFFGSHGIFVGFDPNNQDFNGGYFEDLIAQSSGVLGFGPYVDGFGGFTWNRGLLFGPIRLNTSSWYTTGIATTTSAPLRIDIAGVEINFFDCSTWRAFGISQPAFIDYTSTANIRLLFHRFSGVIVARNMADPTDLLQIDGRTQVVVESNCSDGIIRLYGDGTITVASGAGVTIEDERFNAGQRIDIYGVKLTSNNVEITAVLKRQGKVITDATSASLTIRDNTDPGVTVIPLTTLTQAPNAHGAYVFSLTPAPLLTQGTYTALLSITDPISTVSSQISVLAVP